GDAAYEQGQIESFDWPGDYLDQGRGRVVAELRAAGERGQDRRYEAEGDIVALGAGFRVTLSGDPVPGTGGEYMCLSARHSYTADNYGSGGSDDGDGRAYDGQYVLMPVEAPLLPEQKTARADVRGPQTATVVGEGEIDCDEYGRILVRFHWDLEEAWSMRCRVSQSWAGAGWGGMVIPRIGMEVVVEFLDGDPDKPLVTGCVYNGRNRVPYDLPENKTRSTFRSDTHQGRGFNELRFEDKKGQEEIYLHAEKDIYTAIEDSAAKIVGNNDFEIIQNSRFSTVANLKDDEVGVISLRRVGFADVKIVGPESGVLSQVLDPRKRDSSWGQFDVVERLAQVKALSLASGGRLEPFSSCMMITGSSVTTVGKDMTERVAGNHDMTVAGSQSVDVEGRVDLTAEQTMTLTAGETQEIYAGEAIVLNCGGASLVMTEKGDIEISGRNISVNGKRIDLN
ncbi:type VI secretion system tip protein VgrG, partial [Rhodovulum sulfidophilum]|uniref:type VI secretion system Vgr family protein n=1 Tax=Rhodovulum sulfidophilum TaxID=35806 RepID=UPI001920B713